MQLGKLEKLQKLPFPLTSPIFSPKPHPPLTYLLISKQRAVVHPNYASDLDEVLDGVQQGSVLGPFLLLIHVNNLSSSVSSLTIRMFADDTNACITGLDKSTVALSLKASIDYLNDWFETSLLLNSEKLAE